MSDTLMTEIEVRKALRSAEEFGQCHPPSKMNMLRDLARTYLALMEQAKRAEIEAVDAAAVLRRLRKQESLVPCPVCPHWMHLHEDGRCGSGCCPCRHGLREDCPDCVEFGADHSGEEEP